MGSKHGPRPPVVSPPAPRKPRFPCGSPSTTDPSVTVIAPITVGGALVGTYSIGATLTWGTLLFDVPLTIEHPFAFAVAIPMCALAVGMLGLLHRDPDETIEKLEERLGLALGDPADTERPPVVAAS